MPSKRPNILITISDDQPYYDLSGLGNTEIHTPAQERLMERGVCFDRAYHAGATVAAVCSPSRAQLFTGMPVMNIPNIIKGWWEEGCEKYEAPNPDPACVPMLGELLRRAGYHCFGTGKWHNFQATYIRNFNDGAAIRYTGANPLADTLRKKPQGVDGRYAPDRPGDITRGGHFNQVHCDYDGTGEYSPFAQYIEPRHSTDAFADAATGFLDNYDGEEPFMLYCAFTAPHGPTRTYQEWHDQYPGENVSLPPNFMPCHPFDNGGLFTKERLEGDFGYTEESCRQAIADLYAITAHEDAGIAQIHEALERNGFLDNTIVIHTSDHGKSLGHHGLQGKWSMYEHSIAVPLMLAGPDIPQGEKRDELVYMHDLFPTILEAAGVEIPESTVFHSLWPVLDDNTQRARQYLGCLLEDNQRMIRDDRWKLIAYNVEGNKMVQLYDLENDPHETRNLAGDQEHKGTLQRLLENLGDWQKTFADPFEVAPANADEAVAAPI